MSTGRRVLLSILLEDRQKSSGLRFEFKAKGNVDKTTSNHVAWHGVLQLQLLLGSSKHEQNIYRYRYGWLTLVSQRRHQGQIQRVSLRSLARKHTGRGQELQSRFQHLHLVKSLIWRNTPVFSKETKRKELRLPHSSLNSTVCHVSIHWIDPHTFKETKLFLPIPTPSYTIM